MAYQKDLSISALAALAFGFALYLPPCAPAQAANANQQEYSGDAWREPAPLAASSATDFQARNAGPQPFLRFAQNRDNSRDNNDSTQNDAARAKLQRELDRLREHRHSGGGEERRAPPLPQRRKVAQPSGERAGAGQQQSADPIDPEVNRLVSGLLLFQFTGTHPADPGAKAARSLLQAGLIAGVVFERENVVSKAQLKELIKSFAHVGGPERPLIAANEIGGSAASFTLEKGFEPWPSQQEVASKGDPEYAYSTYVTLASNLGYLGFNTNFGPWIGDAKAARSASDSFGGDPLQAAVFAKTFMLGHREAKMIPVPIVAAGETSVRSLKILLVSFPNTPVAANPTGDNRDPLSLLQNEGVIRGPRFCFSEPKSNSEVERAGVLFAEGCDALIIKGAGDQLTAMRQETVRAVADAVAKGQLTVQRLTASAQRVQALRESLTPNASNAPAQVLDAQPEAD